MRLTQIKLAGFKSFVDPTTIPTPGVLVGVVGPNGCGKSNIIDAVRWVLGETRASELRGATMQDVIFNGSEQRKPAGRAAVELVFDNSQGRAAGQWSSFAEISVRRVLTRDGASSYFINNQLVRRRDVHDMFLGTGLGSRGYAIIGQGMINRLIEARPEELRVYLEEAAGVSRYKERRRETENRLADTRENLARLEDIISELELQLVKLQEQAKVASEYSELRTQGQLRQHALWLLKEQSGIRKQTSLAQQIEAAQQQLQASVAQLAAAEARVEVCRSSHQEQGERVHQAQGQLFEAGALVSRLEAEIRHVVDARKRVQQRSTQLQEQLQQWQQQFEHAQLQLKDLQLEREQAQARAEYLQLAAESDDDKLPELEQNYRQAQLEGAELRRQVAHTEQELALLAQTQRNVAQQWRDLEARRLALLAEQDSSEAPDQALLQELAAGLATQQARVAGLQQDLERLEGEQTTLEQERTQALQTSQQQQHELQGLQARQQALENLQQQTMAADGLQAWLQQQGLQNLGRLWQELQVDDGYALALEAVLHERSQALALRDLGPTQAFGAKPPPARLVFYQTPANPGPLYPAPTGTNALLEHVHCANAGLHALLSHWLAGVFVAADLTQALQVREQLSAGCLIVVPQGHSVDTHSVQFYAAQTASEGLLVRQHEIQQLSGQIRQQSRRVQHSRDCYLQLEERSKELLRALQALRHEQGEQTRSLHATQLQKNQLEQQIIMAQQQAQRLDHDMQGLLTQQQQLQEQGAQAETRFEALDEILAQQQQELVLCESEQENWQQQLDELRAQNRAQERAIQEAGFALRALDNRVAELQRNAQLAAEQSRRASLEFDSLQGELFELDESTAEAGMQAALDARVRHEELLLQARKAQEQAGAELRQADEQRLQLQQQLEPARANITELQLQEQAARLEVEQYSQQLLAAQVERAALSEYIQAQGAQWQQQQWLSSQVQNIARRIEAMGPVNMAALEELQTMSARKKFLDTQHADVLAAIDTLENAIRKIDRETRQLLAQTFATVNEHFAELFPRLFGGGQARLIMTGDEILDAGVQVMAQPPGKRNSSIHLLSGGEKALTAIALVFALFKLNPAPFCLLDEVDAPLDDANTERYTKLVRSMSQQTQFLFISHNKIAMQMAHQLVGVTMQEQGVSRIVAVDMDAALQWAGTA